MATEAQVRANRLNAQKSTGPRTAAGKAVVSQNAVTHGLLARKTVISGEDPGQFETYRAQLLAELHPAGILEAVLAERIVGLAWRLRRADCLQAEVFDTLLARESTPYAKRCLAHLYFGADDGPDPRDSALGRIVISDFRCAKVLERLGLYERRIEQGLYRTLDELEKVRRLRCAEPPAALPPQQEPQPEMPAEEPSCETNPIPQTQSAQRSAHLRHEVAGDGRLGLRDGLGAGGLAFTGPCEPVESPVCTNAHDGPTGAQTGPVTENRELE